MFHLISLPSTKNFWKSKQLLKLIYTHKIQWLLSELAQLLRSYCLCSVYNIFLQVNITYKEKFLKA